MADFGCARRPEDRPIFCGINAIGLFAVLLFSSAGVLLERRATGRKWQWQAIDVVLAGGRQRPIGRADSPGAKNGTGGRGENSSRSDENGDNLDEGSVAICYGILYGNIDVQHVDFWVQYYRAIGVTKIRAYLDLALPSQTREQLQRIGGLTLSDWPIEYWKTNIQHRQNHDWALWECLRELRRDNARHLQAQEGTLDNFSQVKKQQEAREKSAPKKSFYKWVLVCDTDEFLWWDTLRWSDLREFLRAKGRRARSLEMVRILYSIEACDPPPEGNTSQTRATLRLRERGGGEFYSANSSNAANVDDYDLSTIFRRIVYERRTDKNGRWWHPMKSLYRLDALDFEDLAAGSFVHRAPPNVYNRAFGAAKTLKRKSAHIKHFRRWAVNTQMCTVVPRNPEKTILFVARPDLTDPARNPIYMEQVAHPYRRDASLPQWHWFLEAEARKRGMRLFL